MTLSNVVPEVRGQSTQLVVLVHAWTLSSASMSWVRAAIEQAMPHADLLVPDYQAHMFSSADPIAITEALCTALSDAVAARRQKGQSYDAIVLVGHSLGALLVRKAYAFAKGQSQDGLGPLRARPQAWAHLVTRIILLAGTNRGWSLAKKARDLSWVKWLGFRTTDLLWRWFRIGNLINSVRRGAPFVANLRIQWINLVRNADPPPLTIQLLGDSDDIVSEEDNVDVQSGAAFIYLRVAATGHVNVIDFSGPHGAGRRDKFVHALLSPAADLISDKIAPLVVHPEVQHVVFVMHGIRDYGFWTTQLGHHIAHAAKTAGMNVRVITAGYGYFPMLGFILQPERQRNVRWFMDQYTEALATYPHARISFIGHSNGTYLLASALQRYAACAFDRVIFAGSVVRRDFPWDTIVNSGRLTCLQNYVAAADAVVAVLPAVFELLPQSDLGSAGHNGFTSHEGKRLAVTFVNGGHGAALVASNFGALAQFILGDDTSQPNPKLVSNKQSGRVVIASKLCWALWLLLLSVIVAPVIFPCVLGIAGYWNCPVPWWVVALVWPPLCYGILRTV
jgi:alpha-beta hydrolase superfamily lysophospholipase